MPVFTFTVAFVVGAATILAVAVFAVVFIAAAARRTAAVAATGIVGLAAIIGASRIFFIRVLAVFSGAPTSTAATRLFVIYSVRIVGCATISRTILSCSALLPALIAASIASIC